MKQIELKMARGGGNLIFFFLMLMLLSCADGLHQSAVLKIGFHGKKVSTGTYAVFPEGTTQVNISIALEDGTVISQADILEKDLEVIVPAGEALLVSGEVFSGESLTHEGSAAVPPLYPGQHRAVSLTLNELNGPVQIDITADLKPANRPSTFVKFSDDNRYVLFLSQADNLTENDTNHAMDVFVKDLVNNSIRNIHTASDNQTVGNGPVFQADFSGDGRFVVFASAAGNLVADDADGLSDIFLKDLQSGEVRSISGSLSDASERVNDYPSISRDGNAIVFRSYLQNDLGVNEVLYLWQKTITEETLEEVVSGGVISSPIISQGGGRFAYVHVFGGKTRIRLHQTETALTAVTIAVVTGTSSIGLNSSGTFVAFDTEDSHYSADANGRSDVYVHNEADDSKYLVSSDRNWTPLNGSFPKQKLSLSEDARYITFTVGQTAYVKSRITGEVAQFAADVASPGVSTNGEFVTYSTAGGHIYYYNNPIYTSIRKLADGEDAKISPNGSKIAFTKDSQIWTMNEDASNAVIIASAGFNSEPDWSPDGNQIVYRANNSVNIVDSDGQNDYVFAQGSYQQPVWNPDGQNIAMILRGEVDELILKPLCANQTECMSTAIEYLPSEYYNPNWAPLGDYLSLGIQKPLAVDDYIDLWLIDTESKNRLKMTNVGSYNHNPAVSPDGSMIAYDSFASGNRDIWILKLATQQTLQVTTGPLYNYAPIWSPGGTKLYYTVTNSTESTHEIQVLDLGTNIVFPDVPHLENTDGLLQIDSSADLRVANGTGKVLKFSNNNQLVLFLSDADNLSDNDTNGSTDLFLKNLVNGSIVNLHTNSAGIQGNGTVTSADMSPDGRWVVFASDSSNLVPDDTDGESDIFRVDVASGQINSISASLTEPAGAMTLRSNTEPYYDDNNGYIIFRSSYVDASNQLVNEVIWYGYRFDIAQINQLSLIGVSGNGSYMGVLTGDTLEIRYGSIPTAIVETVGTVNGTTTVAMDSEGVFLLFDSTLMHSPLDQNGLLDLYMYNKNDKSFWLMSSNEDWTPLTGNGSGFQPSMSEDAQYVAFQIDTTIYVKSRNTGQLATLPFPGQFPTLTQDGSKFSFIAMDNHVYIADNPLYSKIRKIPADFFDAYPDIHPVGDQIVFQTDAGDIWSMNKDGSNRTALTVDPLDEVYPVWSPNGTKIAYKKNNTTTSIYELWVMNANGSGQQILYNEFPSNGAPSWSPDGTKLSFHIFNTVEQVVTKLVNDTNPATILNVVIENARNPVWGPVAYGNITSPLAVIQNGQIWIVDETGVEPPDQMTTDASGSTDPDWSPDGKLIAFARNSEIWVLDVASKQTLQLTNNYGYNSVTPVWNKDGTKLLFDKTNDDGFWEIDLSGGIQFPTQVVP